MKIIFFMTSDCAIFDDFGHAEPAMLDDLAIATLTLVLRVSAMGSRVLSQKRTIQSQ